ncbi:trypsin-like serine peptidase [Roseobacter litoralis]|uniref:trypsin-like serine peptidase n=1 Tax=Roseobacter litoralis TaxID=42443 RepID=UPI0024903DA8|nr:trypsin-like serine protease [Roseobacter litoralis]
MPFLKMLFYGFVVSVCLTTLALSEGLPVVDGSTRSDWTAVGAVIAQGTEGGSSCSGTLVAPDLIITAAHCTTQKEGLLDSLRFFAGQDGTRFVASSGSIDIIRHPDWADATGSDKYRFDVAVVRLSRPIARDVVSPVLLVPAQRRLPQEAVFLGYQNNTGPRLHGRFDCALYPLTTQGLLTSECHVIRGNSGGAVVVQLEQNWYLAGTIVARREPDGTALAAQLNDWLRGHVSAALKREAQRLAR